MKKLTTEEFIAKAKYIHNDFYIYNSEYVNSREEILIECPVHGIFKQMPRDHLSKKGCPLCGRLKTIESNRKSYEDFVNVSKQIHSDKYSYLSENESGYKDSVTKITIYCPIHGMFKQSPNSHLMKHGCSKCSIDNKIKRTSTGFLSMKKVLNNKELYKTIPYQLYLVLFETNSNSNSIYEKFYKIGLTKHKLNKRFSGPGYKDYEITTIDVIETNLFDGYIMEQKVLNKVINYRPNIKFNGYNECFIYEYRDLIINDLL